MLSGNVFEDHLDALQQIFVILGVEDQTWDHSRYLRSHKFDHGIVPGGVVCKCCSPIWAEKLSVRFCVPNVAAAAFTGQNSSGVSQLGLLRDTHSNVEALSGRGLGCHQRQYGLK